MVREAGKEEFRLPAGAGGSTYFFRDAAVWRKAETDGKPIAVLKNVKSSRMVEDRRGTVTVWRWELELQPRRKEGKLRPLFTFLAVSEEKP